MQLLMPCPQQKNFLIIHHPTLTITTANKMLLSYNKAEFYTATFHIQLCIIIVQLHKIIMQLCLSGQVYVRHCNHNNYKKWQYI